MTFNFAPCRLRTAATVGILTGILVATASQPSLAGGLAGNERPCHLGTCRLPATCSATSCNPFSFTPSCGGTFNCCEPTKSLHAQLVFTVDDQLPQYPPPPLFELSCGGGNGTTVATVRVLANGVDTSQVFSEDSPDTDPNPCEASCFGGGAGQQQSPFFCTTSGNRLTEFLLKPAGDLSLDMAGWLSFSKFPSCIEGQLQGAFGESARPVILDACRIASQDHTSTAEPSTARFCIVTRFVPDPSLSPSACPASGDTPPAALAKDQQGNCTDLSAISICNEPPPPADESSVCGSEPSTPDPNTCAAGKKGCVRKKAMALLRCHAAAKRRGRDPLGDAAVLKCVQRATDRFDGGGDPDKGCIEKLEAKQKPNKPKTICPTVDDTASLELKVDAFVDQIVRAVDPGFPAPARNVCSATKMNCVAKAVGALLTCHEKAERTGQGPQDPKFVRCLDKARSGFHGPPDKPERGCFAKVEAKQNPSKPEKVCPTEGDRDAISTSIEALVQDVVSMVDP